MVALVRRYYPKSNTNVFSREPKEIFLLQANVFAGFFR
jgi:hypothetical protein